MATALPVRPSRIVCVIYALAGRCGASDANKHALVVHVPLPASSLSLAWQYFFSVPMYQTALPSHSTGIPDDKVRRVKLAAGSDSCRTYDIEQVVGGVDTGSVLWSGSVVLAEHMNVYAAALGLDSSSTVLELGAGLGLVSVVASCLGASVVATDGDQAILPVMARNVLRHVGTGRPGNVIVSELLWGDVAGARALGSFDVIIGADLVYGSDSVVAPAAREASFAKLLCTMWLLSRENTTIVLAYRERQPSEALFFERLWERFEPLVEGGEAPAAVPHMRGVPESRGVRVYTFRRRPRHGDEADDVPYCVAPGVREQTSV